MRTAPEISLMAPDQPQARRVMGLKSQALEGGQSPIARRNETKDQASEGSIIRTERKKGPAASYTSTSERTASSSATAPGRWGLRLPQCTGWGRHRLIPYLIQLVPPGSNLDRTTYEVVG